MICISSIHVNSEPRLKVLNNVCVFTPLLIQYSDTCVNGYKIIKKNKIKFKKEKEKTVWIIIVGTYHSIPESFLPGI